MPAAKRQYITAHTTCTTHHQHTVFLSSSFLIFYFWISQYSHILVPLLTSKAPTGANGWSSGAKVFGSGGSHGPGIGLKLSFLALGSGERPLSGEKAPGLKADVGNCSTEETRERRDIVKADAANTSFEIYGEEDVDEGEVRRLPVVKSEEQEGSVSTSRLLCLFVFKVVVASSCSCCYVVMHT